jgi:large-conductance mechanosensitive channel
MSQPSYRRSHNDQGVQGLPFQRQHRHYGAFLTDLIQFVAIDAAVFFFIVKPVQMMLARSRREPIEEGMPDEERRHQELLAALRASN